MNYSINNMAEITTHERLVKLWAQANEVPGSKARMDSMGHSYTGVRYIVNTPSYQDEAKMELVIQCLKQISAEHRAKVEETDNNIQGI